MDRDVDYWLPRLVRSSPATRLWYGLRSTLDRPMHGGSAESPMWRKRGFSKRDTRYEEIILPYVLRTQSRNPSGLSRFHNGKEESGWERSITVASWCYHTGLLSIAYSGVSMVLNVPRGQFSLATPYLVAACPTSALLDAGSDLESKTSQSWARQSALLLSVARSDDPLVDIKSAPVLTICFG